MTDKLPREDRGRLLLGTQGFSFDDWVGPFYPDGTPKKRYLEEYANHFPSVEIDATFYAIPRITVVEGWESGPPKASDSRQNFPN